MITVPAGLTDKELAAWLDKYMRELEDVFIVDAEGNETPAPLVPLTGDDNGPNRNPRPGENLR